MPKEKTDRYEKVIEELEEIVSQLAQQTDSRATNLQVSIEQQQKFIEERDRKRWTWFLVIFTSVFLALAILNIEMWERQNDRINAVQYHATKIETSLEFLKDQIVKKYEFIQQLNEHTQKSADEREKKDKELESRIIEVERRLPKRGL